MARQITLDTSTHDCPGAICKVRLAGTDKSVLVQIDFDAPGIASTFGWSIQNVQRKDWHKTYVSPCDHSGTDGTIDCRECGIKAITFINAAREFIRANDGVIAEDPGYFSESEA